MQGLTLADDEVKPTLDDDQTNALTKAFKEADGFTYTIDCGLLLPKLLHSSAMARAHAGGFKGADCPGTRHAYASNSMNALPPPNINSVLGKALLKTWRVMADLKPSDGNSEGDAAE